MGADDDRLMRLLGSGGDERIALSSQSRLNPYGYGVAPQADELGFGSSTANTISAAAFEALSDEFAFLDRRLRVGGETAFYADGMAAVRRTMRLVIGFDEGESDIILAPSGTDIHLIAAMLLARADRRPLQTITLTANETGSGVALAAEGRHFAGTAPAGAAVIRKGRLALDDLTSHIALSVRDGHGCLRPPEEIENELAQVIASASRDGRRCLLVVTDVSKTGLIAPSLKTVLSLKQRYADTLEVMIDACQFRVSPDTIRAYLRQDFPVAITGSKFMGGPVFSGALLVPRSLAERLREIDVPEAIGHYSSRFEWPERWKACKTLPARANLGLLLRWRAALFQMTELFSHSDAALKSVALAFSRTVSDRLAGHPVLQPLQSHPLDRSVLPGATPGGWDEVQTIFSFFLKDAQTGRPFEQARTKAIYDRLARLGVRLGQPVAYATDGAALRLCLSAPLMAKACTSGAAATTIMRNAEKALEMTATIASDMIQPSVTSSPVVSPLKFLR